MDTVKTRPLTFQIREDVELKIMRYRAAYNDKTPQYELLNELLTEILDQKLKKQPA